MIQYLGKYGPDPSSSRALASPLQFSSFLLYFLIFSICFLVFSIFILVFLVLVQIDFRPPTVFQISGLRSAESGFVEDSLALVGGRWRIHRK